MPMASSPWRSPISAASCRTSPADSPGRESFPRPPDSTGRPEHVKRKDLIAMANTAQATTLPKESFSALLEESIGAGNGLEGSVLKGVVVAVENDFALIDVGLKSEGRVQLKEFSGPGQQAEIKVGDTVEVYLERMEDKNGEAVLSRDKARREESWTIRPRRSCPPCARDRPRPYPPP